ncbi:MAG: hypothetical protein ACI8RD_010937 [Bacillariaceae sp.]|jgi:hypothetical protein
MKYTHLSASPQYQTLARHTLNRSMKLTHCPVIAFNPQLPSLSNSFSNNAGSSFVI